MNDAKAIAQAKKTGDKIVRLLLPHHD